MNELNHIFTKGDVADNDGDPAVTHDGQRCRISNETPEGWEFGPEIEFADGTVLLARDDEVAAMRER